MSLLQQENEKLKSDIEKIRSELRYKNCTSNITFDALFSCPCIMLDFRFRYEVDKVTAGLRLDLNLEKGYIFTN